MSRNQYQSSVQVPASAMQRFHDRAKELWCSKIQLARIMLALAIEQGQLPSRVPSLEESDEVRVNFPFKLDSDLVDALGGEEQARDLLRWVIMEGLDQSPFGKAA